MLDAGRGIYLCGSAFDRLPCSAVVMQLLQLVFAQYSADGQDMIVHDVHRTPPRHFSLLLPCWHLTLPSTNHPAHLVALLSHCALDRGLLDWLT